MKNYLVVGAVLLVAVAGFLVWSNSQKSQPEPKMTEEKAMFKDEKTSSRYIEYSKAKLDEAKDKRRVLYFYANWCPLCRPADLNFKENTAKIPENVVVIRVNYADSDTDQEEKDLAQKYEIIYQHTYVQIDSQGKEIAKWNGGQIEELLTNLK